jgi:hypothetical protein
MRSYPITKQERKRIDMSKLGFLGLSLVLIAVAVVITIPMIILLCRFLLKTSKRVIVQTIVSVLIVGACIFIIETIIVLFFPQFYLH